MNLKTEIGAVLGELSRFHSVFLEEDSCTGCTTCVTTCPVEAIRVRNGKAHILEERCIDCGECIRRCPNRAKRALASSLANITENFEHRIILVPPSFYAQFNKKYSSEAIQTALLSLGFDRLYNVSDYAFDVSFATAEYLKNKKALRPIISSSCPVIIKLIQTSFPSLIDNILPVLPPVELAAMDARKKASREGFVPEKVGVFFLSPCPAKITIPRAPLGYEYSAITGVFSIAEIYLLVRNAMKSNAVPKENAKICLRHPFFNQALIWGMSDGESDTLQQAIALQKENQTVRWLSCDGIDHVLKVLEVVEEGALDDFDFIEMSACSGGCIGGSLAVESVPVAHANMRQRFDAEFCASARQHNEEESQTDKKAAFEKMFDEAKTEMFSLKECLWNLPIEPRPALLLSEDFAKARRMLAEIDSLVAELPALNCGACGSPNCRALAEDIVRCRAQKEDCVHILKQKYEQLLFGGNRLKK